MRRARRPGEEQRMEMTPMIDVTFLLLIFFMCTLRFKSLEGKLAAFLPKDAGLSHSPAEPLERTSVVVRVLRPGERLRPDGAPWDPARGGRYVYGADRRVVWSVGPWETEDPAALEARLSDTRARLARLSSEAPRAVLDAREGTTADDVVATLDRLLAAGYRDVTFAGSSADQ